MKISEVTTNGKISKIMPNQSAEIDHGDGTKTVVDLKKNPTALTKDPTSGKVKLNKAKGGQGNTPNPKQTINPNDSVETDDS